jgi:hypothetical protein
MWQVGGQLNQKYTFIAAGSISGKRDLNFAKFIVVQQFWQLVTPWEPKSACRKATRSEFSQRAAFLPSRGDWTPLDFFWPACGDGKPGYVVLPSGFLDGRDQT